MYKKTNFFNKYLIIIAILVTGFLGVLNVSANTVINDGGGSSDGAHGINRATCVYKPFEGVKFTLTYTPRGGVKHAFEYIMPIKNTETKTIYINRTPKQEIVSKSPYYILGKAIYAEANFMEKGKIVCPILLSNIKETKSSRSYLVKFDDGTSGYVTAHKAELNFTTGAGANDGGYVQIVHDANESKIETDGRVGKICVYTFDQRRERAGGVVESFGDKVLVTIDTLRAEYTSSNIYASASNGYKVNVSREIKESDIFTTDGECRTNFLSYCEYKKECHMLPLGTESKLAVPAYADANYNRSPSELSSYLNGLTATFKTGFSTCNDLRELLDFTSDMYGLIVTFVVVGLVVFGMLDFGKAVVSDKPDANQKAFKSFKTRALIAIIIILLPALLNFTFEVFNSSGDEGYTTCVPKT